MKEVDSY